MGAGQPRRLSGSCFDLICTTSTLTRSCTRPAWPPARNCGPCRLAYGTEDPYAEVTLWAYIHGLATLVLDGPPALGAGDEVQRFAHDAINAPYFTQGTTISHDSRAPSAF